MKLLSALLISLFIITGLSAQDTKNTKESAKENARIKKEERDKKIENEFRLTDELINSKSFVLEAQSLRNTRGVQVQVSTLLNFISIDSADAILQIGSMSRSGFNGVGGITEEGRISNWKVNKDEKRKSFNLFMTVQSKFNTYDITMFIDYSGHAEATITGLRAGRLTFTGDLVSRENSSIFKGQAH